MKKILLLIGLTTLLLASECPLKSDIYTRGYNEGNKEKSSDDVGSSNAALSGFCEGFCKGEIMSGTKISMKSCYSLCINAAKEGLNGSKPKMKLCE